MRLLFIVILTGAFGALPLLSVGMAQDSNVMSAAQTLQGVLSTLKESVEKLSLDNDQLSSKDKDIKTQVSQLKTQLERLEYQGDVLKRTAAHLQDKNPHRAQQITRLEKENSDLDERIQKAQDSIQSIQQSLDAGHQSPGIPATDRQPQEKQRLIKMIEESQERQDALRHSILEYQKNNTSSSVSNQWDDAQLSRLERELKVLEKNYIQLKDLMEKMSKKVQNTRMTTSQQIEEEKLHKSLHDINMQSAGLRADLDDLRSQMVELDKRKSSLEVLIRQAP